MTSARIWRSEVCLTNGGPRNSSWKEEYYRISKKPEVDHRSKPPRCRLAQILQGNRCHWCNLLIDLEHWTTLTVRWPTRWAIRPLWVNRPCRPCRKRLLMHLIMSTVPPIFNRSRSSGKNTDPRWSSSSKTHASWWMSTTHNHHNGTWPPPNPKYASSATSGPHHKCQIIKTSSPPCTNRSLIELKPNPNRRFKKRLIKRKLSSPRLTKRNW